MTWYDEPGTPDVGIYWWALEHKGHPCCYLRALMPGDFAPGRAPAPRHVLGLDGLVPAELRCGTCGEAPAAGDLEPIERATGQRGFLASLRSGARAWPKATDPASCWLCSAPRAQADRQAPVGPGGSTVAVCAGCARHLSARDGRRD